MYNYDFLCTYHLITDDEELSKLCYQQQLLQAFNLKYYDNKKINETIEKIYNEIKNINEFNELINRIRENLDDLQTSYIFDKINQVTSDNHLSYYLLFSYEYFNIFHKKYCLFKEKKNI